jgi:alpha-N-acetylglucosaminidase
MSLTVVTLLLSILVTIANGAFTPSSQLLAAASPTTSAATQTQAVQALAVRLLGGRATEFSLSVTGQQAIAGQDEFSILSNIGTNQIAINGTTGVAVASGLYYYLKTICNAQVTWGVNGTGNQLSLPSTLTPVYVAIQMRTPNLFRYYMNVCTVSYSGAWWDWTRWQNEIDWMALHGINLPLTFTGQEIVWQQLWTEVGLTPAEIQRWLAGPAFLAWQRMGNIRGWAGPLTSHWIAQQAALGVQIAKRQSDLGMINVLPGFAGHVPEALRRIYPGANITQSPNWWGSPAQYCCDFLLEPRDPLFTKLGSRFYQLVVKQFGSSKIFNSDTFNEMLPASNDPTYLAQTSAAVYSALAAYDNTAIWLMQGWLFVNDPGFWTQPAIQAYLAGAPDNGTLILDLWSEAVPVWSKTQSYYGKPFIWCMLHNFGGNRDLYGNLDVLAQQPIAARNAPGSTMVGTGLTPEAIEQNPIVYELMTDMGWLSRAPSVGNWLAAYVTQRYGSALTPRMLQAWGLLRVGAYSNIYMTDSAITHVPDLSMPTHSQRLQNFSMIAAAWRFMYTDLIALPTPLPGPLLYDALDLLRQTLCNLFEDARHIHAAAYNEYMLGNNTRSSQDVLHSLRGLGGLITSLIGDLDSLLATNPNFLLGTWTTTARAWAGSAAEASQLQFNALNQITLWGDEGEINDYAAKQWSPLVADYYYERWTMFVDAIEFAVASSVPFDATTFDNDVLNRDLLWNYANNDTVYPTTTTGDQIAVSKTLTARYVLMPSAAFAALVRTNAASPSQRLYSVQTLTRDVPSLAYLCLADPLCGGFTTEGFLLVRGAQTTPSASGVTTYVRN